MKISENSKKNSWENKKNRCLHFWKSDINNFSNEKNRNGHSLTLSTRTHSLTCMHTHTLSLTLSLLHTHTLSGTLKFTTPFPTPTLSGDVLTW